MTISSVGEWRNRQWKDEESTNAVLKRDTRVDVHGSDKTLEETKKDQQLHVGLVGGAELAIAGAKGLEIAHPHVGIMSAEAAAGLELGATIALPVLGLVAGAAGLAEAHEFADEQQAAIVKDQAHVALAGALDLPAGCKERAFAERSGTPRGPSSQAFKMTENIMKDKAGLAVLQAHCDRGVMSAYAAVPMPMPEGMTLDKFLESRPQLKQICDEDAAFKVGFESYWNAGAADRKELLASVDKHDVRSGLTSVHIGG